MEKLKQRIREEGKIRGTNELLKVDSFLNHQMDTAFLAELGQAFREPFDGCQVDRSSPSRPRASASPWPPPPPSATSRPLRQEE